MDFNILKFIYQLINFALLIGLTLLIILIPLKILKRLKIVEGRLNDLSRKVDSLHSNNEL